MTSINFTANKGQNQKILAIAGALLILAFPYALMLGEHSHIETEQSLCPFRLLTGFPCPGCGITKSLLFLYEGQLQKSFYYHLFGPFTFIFCLLLIITLCVELFTGKTYFRQVIYHRKLAYALGTGLALYHSWRLIYFVLNHNVQEILHDSVWQ